MVRSLILLINTMEKPYRVVLKSGETIALTEHKFQKMHEWRLKAKLQDLYDIHDDTGKYSMSIVKTDISRMYRSGGNTHNTSTEYMCDYGERHDEDLRCTCHMTYNNMSGIKFYRLLREGGFEIRYPSDITAEMKTYIRRWITEHAYDNRVKDMPLEQKQEIIARAQSFKTPIPF